MRTAEDPLETFRISKTGIRKPAPNFISMPRVARSRDSFIQVHGLVWAGPGGLAKRNTDSSIRNLASIRSFNSSRENGFEGERDEDAHSEFSGGRTVGCQRFKSR